MNVNQGRSSRPSTAILDVCLALLCVLMISCDEWKVDPTKVREAEEDLRKSGLLGSYEISFGNIISNALKRFFIDEPNKQIMETLRSTVEGAVQDKIKPLEDKIQQVLEGGAADSIFKVVVFDEIGKKSLSFEKVGSPPILRIALSNRFDERNNSTADLPEGRKKLLPSHTEVNSEEPIKYNDEVGLYLTRPASKGEKVYQIPLERRGFLQVSDALEKRYPDRPLRLVEIEHLCFGTSLGMDKILKLGHLVLCK